MWLSLRLYKTSYPQDFLDMQRRWLSSHSIVWLAATSSQSGSSFFRLSKCRDKEARLIIKTHCEPHDMIAQNGENA